MILIKELRTDQEHSGGHRLRRSSCVCHRTDKEGALRGPVYTGDSSARFDGGCYLRRLCENCILGRPTRVKDTKLPLGSP
jgi:hypothetical protein